MKKATFYTITITDGEYEVETVIGDEPKEHPDFCRTNLKLRGKSVGNRYVRILDAGGHDINDAGEYMTETVDANGLYMYTVSKALAKFKTGLGKADLGISNNIIIYIALAVIAVAVGAKVMGLY
ncbi:MAG: hypothetical protein WC936_06455 [Candidatus Nanoarchaeia archaeon]|jgi:hypothetical protein